ncbi:HAD family hydrolase [Steroidobacter sp.]|uniref:HAD family hydrolase n=1 Tax=Steroidobacter sp. TaxID=1978227 RepID=UPI001A41EBCC|nr:HAD family phosphatase [Steroidobacter sp.]MBL8264736.1 HAD family phosphatase [Steroidobacter sp.]
MSIRLVVFDFDGVLIDFDPQLRSSYLERLTGKRGEDIHAATWGSEFERDAERGAYTTGDAYLAAFNERLGFELSRAQWIEARRAAMRLRPDMVEYARSLSERVPLALLTNNGALLREALPELVPEVCAVFTKNLHASYEFRARKPDVAVFTRLLKHCLVPAHQAVFIDDDRQFIQGAISAGMHGIHFQSLPTLRATLEPLLATGA